MAIKQQNGVTLEEGDLPLGEPEYPGASGNTGDTGSGTPEPGTTDTTGNSYAVGPSNVIDTTKTPTKMTDINSELGHGLEAAEGTNYSWDKKAAERANYAYQSDVLTAKQNYLQQRQNIEQQGQQMQTQYDMDQYSRNQSAEKVGWTGGYALDEKRQMDYLKSTIQSQMYGSMELQKYGYDTSLAAARLAYDTNKYDLALEYYNTALSRAVTSAELTGVYISPEAEEMRGQFFAAEEKLKENPNDENAQRVKEATRQWFESNGISENGVYTLNALMELNVLYESMWDKIDSTYKNKDLYRLDGETFINVNATPQQIALNGETAYLINFNNMSPEETKEYILSDPTGRAREQYLSGVDAAGDTLANDLQEKLIQDGFIKETKNNDGSVSYELTTSETAMKEKIAQYLSMNSDIIKDAIQEKINKISEDPELVKMLFENYTKKLDMPGNVPDLLVHINLDTNKTSLTKDAELYSETKKQKYLEEITDMDSKIASFEEEIPWGEQEVADDLAVLKDYNKTSSNTKWKQDKMAEETQEIIDRYEKIFDSKEEKNNTDCHYYTYRHK